MINIVIKVKEVEDDKGKAVEVFVHAKNEGLATDREADFSEKLLAMLTPAMKEVAESIGPCETEEFPTTIIKKLASAEDIENEKSKRQ